MTYRYALVVAQVLMLFKLELAVAQSAPPATQAESSDRLQEIIVTATKREANIQDVPISISVLSAKDIAERRVETLDDIARAVPSLTYVSGSGAENYISIRGAVTIDDSSGTDQAVSVFVDDVVRTGVADYSPDIFDVDRVETLKGPQGTLFGRNSLGGAVAIYTKNPTFTPEGQVEVSYGNFNLGELKAMINSPLIADTLAARLAVTVHTLDGWADDPIIGRNLGSETRMSARGKLLYQPSSDLTSLLTFDVSRNSGSRTDWILGNFQPALDSPLLFGRDSTASSAAGYTLTENWGLTEKIDWRTPVGTLTSITGYRHVNSVDSTSPSVDPQDVVTLTSASHDGQTTEELRFASAADQKLTWVSGVYYLFSQKSRPINILFDILPGSFYDSIGIGPGPINSIVNQNTNTHSEAIFGEATYPIVDTLEFTAGVRYTHESKDGFSFLNPSGTIAGPPASASYDGAWSAVTPKGSLTYKLIPELMLYTTVSKGFQGGGFNTQGSTPAALSTPFSPTIVWNYEIGEKFENANHELQANVSAFVDRYSELQIVSFDGATQQFSTTNAGAADVKGVEADFAALPAPWLTLTVNYTGMTSKFTNYVINNGPGSPLTIYTGNKVPFVPANRVTAGAELHLNAPWLAGRVDVGGDYTYRSSIEADAANDLPQFVLDRTVWNGLINAHATWSSYDGRWSAQLWGKNLRNIEYTEQTGNETGLFETPAEFNNPNNQIWTYHPNPPRTFGITLRASF